MIAMKKHDLYMGSEVDDAKRKQGEAGGLPLVKHGFTSGSR